jgi:hypothetical protein
MGEQGTLEVVIDKGVPEAVLASLPVSQSLDLLQGIETDEVIKSIIDLIGGERDFVSLPKRKGLKHPSVVEVMQGIFNLG